MFEDGAEQVAPDCSHEVFPGTVVRGPLSLKLVSGRYVARFGFTANARCATGNARLEVLTTGRFGRELASYTGRIEPGQRIDLPFHLTTMDAALGVVEFRVSGLSDCVLLSSAQWADASR
jgi:hypothetical protein